MVEDRVRGFSYNQTLKKTESKIKEVSQVNNSLPICERVVRALNANPINVQSHKPKHSSFAASNHNEDIDYEDDEKHPNKLPKNNSMDPLHDHNKSMPIQGQISKMSKRTSPHKSHFTSNISSSRFGAQNTSSHTAPYHLYITDEGRFLEKSVASSKLEPHKMNISFEKQTRKQYISPRYEASETLHRNPEFNKLDIKSMDKVKSFDISKGESRDKFMQKFRAKIPGLVPKTQAEYEPIANKLEQPKNVKSPRFERMLDRCVINSIYY